MKPTFLWFILVLCFSGFTTPVFSAPAASSRPRVNYHAKFIEIGDKTTNVELQYWKWFGRVGKVLYTDPQKTVLQYSAWPNEERMTFECSQDHFVDLPKYVKRGTLALIHDTTQAVGIRVMYVGGNPGYIRHKYKMGWITRVSTTEVTLRYSARDGGGEQVFQGAIPSEFLLLDDGLSNIEN